MTELAQLTLAPDEVRLLLLLARGGVMTPPVQALIAARPEVMMTFTGKLVRLAEWWQAVMAEGRPRG